MCSKSRTGSRLSYCICKDQARWYDNNQSRPGLPWWQPVVCRLGKQQSPVLFAGQVLLGNCSPCLLRFREVPHLMFVTRSEGGQGSPLEIVLYKEPQRDLERFDLERVECRGTVLSWFQIHAGLSQGRQIRLILSGFRKWDLGKPELKGKMQSRVHSPKCWAHGDKKHP